MSDGSEPTVAQDGPADPATVTAVPEAPQDPVERALTPVDEAMVQARGSVSAPGDVPAVPTEDEVAALEHAHEVLRSTLDRVDRGG